MVKPSLVRLTSVVGREDQSTLELVELEVELLFEVLVTVAELELELVDELEVEEQAANTPMVSTVRPEYANFLRVVFIVFHPYLYLGEGNFFL